MPKPKLIDTYSFQELKYMSEIGSIILYNFLWNDLTEAQRLDLHSKISTFNILAQKPEYAKPLYEDDYPELAQLYEENNNDSEEINRKFTRKTENNNPYSLNFSTLGNTYYTNEAFEKPINDYIKAMKEISGLLKKHVKSNGLSDTEKTYVDIFQEITDDMIEGKGYLKKMIDNPAYLFMQNHSSTQVKVNSPMIQPKVENNLIELVSVGDVLSEWKTEIDKIEKTPIADTLKQCLETKKALDAYNTSGDVTKEELLAHYESLKEASTRLFNISQEDFKKIHDNGGVQDTYENVIKNDRANRYVMYDAEARVELLKAGYPVSDLSVLATFYRMMSSCKHFKELKLGNPESYQNLADKMSPVWDKVINTRPLTEQSRKEALQAVKDCCEELGNALANGEYPDTQFSSENNSFLSMSKFAQEQLDAKLSVYESVGLSKSPAVMYKLLNTKEVDPGSISSSAEFAAMKEALLHLSTVDKEKYPEKYRYFKDVALEKTKAYLDYKNKELHDPKKSHKRSVLEARRVKSANAIYEGLNALDKDELLAERMENDKLIVDDQMDDEYAEHFADTSLLIEQSLAEIANELEVIKSVLQRTHDIDKMDYNFENTDQMTGSKVYREFTQSIQKAIDTVKSEDSKPGAIQEALANVISTANAYKKDKDNSIFGTNQTRYDMSVKIINDMPKYRSTYDSIRLGLENYKDENHSGYRSKPISVIKAKVNELENANPDLKNREGYDVKQEFNRVHARTLKQRALRSLISEKNKFMTDNYLVNRSADYYVAMKGNPGVSEMADIYVAKKYLDKIYDADVETKDLIKIEKDLKANALSKESKALSKNIAFKAVVKKSPGTALKDWKAVEFAADKIQKDADDFLTDYQGDKKDLLDAVLQDPEGRVRASAKFTVYNILSSPNGRAIAEIMALDPEADKKQIIDSFVNTVADYYEDVFKKSNYSKNPIHFCDDEEIVKKAYEKMLNSQKQSIKNKENSSKAKVNNIVNQQDIKPIGL